MEAKEIILSIINEKRRQRIYPPLATWYNIVRFCEKYNISYQETEKELDRLVEAGEVERGDTASAGKYYKIIKLRIKN